jgi:hypothetical protein
MTSIAPAASSVRDSIRNATNTTKVPSRSTYTSNSSITSSGADSSTSSPVSVGVEGTAQSNITSLMAPGSKSGNGAGQPGGRPLMAAAGALVLLLGALL